MSNLFNADYQKIFPENLKKYKNLKELANQFEKSLKQEIISELPKLAIYKNLEIQSDEVLSELAYQYGVDNWEESISREIKIRLIKNAIMVHRKKGTKFSIENNLKKLNRPLKVEEWWEYGGAPFTFKITTSIFKSDEWLGLLLDIIEKYKNCRSVIETIEINGSKNCNFKNGAYLVRKVEKEFFETKNNKAINCSKKFGLFKIIEMEVIYV